MSAEPSMVLYYDAVNGRHLNSSYQQVNHFSAPVLIYRTTPVIDIILVQPNGSAWAYWPTGDLAVTDSFQFSVDRDGIATDTPMARATNAAFVLNPESGMSSRLRFTLNCATTEFRDAVAGNRPNKPVTAEGQLYITEYGDTYPYLVATFLFRAYNVVDDFTAGNPTSL